MKLILTPHYHHKDVWVVIPDTPERPSPRNFIHFLHFVDPKEVEHFILRLWENREDKAT